MPGIDAVIVPASQSVLSQAMKEAQNRPESYINFAGANRDARLDIPPRWHVHIFNISRVEHKVARPPSWPGVPFRACPRGEPWALVGKMPEIVTEYYINTDTGAPTTYGWQAERLATDFLNPANLSNDWRVRIRPDAIDESGTDLTRRGMFWSHDAVPSKADLETARAQMIQHYQQCVQRASQYFSEGFRNQIGPEDHAAVEYLLEMRLLKSDLPWHTGVQIPSICENCGGEFRSGAAFHMSPDGIICVVDWKKAVAAGAKRREDVPFEHRWWKDAPSDIGAPKAK